MTESGGWLVLSVMAPMSGREFLVVDALRRLGARSVARQAERVVAHMPAPPDVDALLRQAESSLRAASAGEPAMLWHVQTQAEWADEWSRDQAARRVTPRIVVVPGDRDLEGGIRDDDVVIRLGPGPAFGTAEHATTRGCLQLLDGRVRPGDELLDIGTGTGILAVAAVLLGAKSVFAIDADSLSCDSARQNAELNGVGDRIDVEDGVAGADYISTLGPVDGIAANLAAPLIISLLPAMHEVLKPGGWMIVSGITRPERDDVRRAATQARLAVANDVDVEGWWSAELRRS